MPFPTVCRSHVTAAPATLPRPVPMTDAWPPSDSAPAPLTRGTGHCRGCNTRARHGTHAFPRAAPTSGPGHKARHASTHQDHDACYTRTAARKVTLCLCTPSNNHACHQVTQTCSTHCGTEQPRPKPPHHPLAHQPQTHCMPHTAAHLRVPAPASGSEVQMCMFWSLHMQANVASLLPRASSRSLNSLRWRFSWLPQDPRVPSPGPAGALQPAPLKTGRRVWRRAQQDGTAQLTSAQPGGCGRRSQHYATQKLHD